MELLGIISAFGLSASAGVNAYIPLLTVALLVKFTNLVTLKPPYDTLANWWIIGLLVVLTAIEFFADKAPAVNHVNDIIQTFVRPTAGAIIFAASARVITDVHPVLSLALGLLVAGGVHATKSLAVRPAVSMATAGVGNVPVSIAEDVFAVIISVLAVAVPVVLACLAIIVTTWIVMRIIHHGERASSAS